MGKMGKKIAKSARALERRNVVYGTITCPFCEHVIEIDKRSVDFLQARSILNGKIMPEALDYQCTCGATAKVELEEGNVTWNKPEDEKQNRVVWYCTKCGKEYDEMPETACEDCGNEGDGAYTTLYDEDLMVNGVQYKMTDDLEHRKNIMGQLHENSKTMHMAFCPCQLERTPDQVCQCKKFRDGEGCCCKLFVRVDGQPDDELEALVQDIETDILEGGDDGEKAADAVADDGGIDADTERLQ